MRKSKYNTSNNLPNLVIIGGGFGGLTLAKALKRAPINITLIDRQNHHLFQPLL
ncbi:MAG: FAD-dependent oxidoreductase, partial [SAR324 cluster bacterium]|nr:FAD-dependent oxidoreductase [SAR324 cluster bacterium]